MSKLFIPLLFALGLCACKESAALTEYLDSRSPKEVPEIFAPDIVSQTGRLEHGISFTPDMREMAFGILDSEDFSGEILYAKREGAHWSKPKLMDALRVEGVFLPYFSPDGTSMLFAKSKPDADNYITDIWMLSKSDDTWGHPVKVDSSVSTSTRESAACMTLDNKIYFSSNRGGNGLADIYVSTLENRKYLNAERLDVLSTVRDEESIFIAPDERYIIFSRYATDQSGPDLFISYRDSNQNWTLPIVLESSVNTGDWERRPFVSFDNKFLFYTKLTMDESGLKESDIYWVNTKKVFKPYVYNPIIETTLKIGRETEVRVPADYFRDIDNNELDIGLMDSTPEWIELDRDKMSLVMNPTEIGTYDVMIYATDENSNMTSHTLKIIVEK